MSPPAPVMTPFELSLEVELDVEAQRFGNAWLFQWYGMTYEGGKTDVEDFRGGRISYAGLKFDDQKQQVFWQAIGRYLDQKVHEVFKRWDAETRTYSNAVRRQSVDGVELILRRFMGRIVAHAKETDRRLRGGGRPESVPPVDDVVGHVYAGGQISNLAMSHRVLLDQAIEREAASDIQLSRKQRVENWLSSHKGILTALGIGIAALGLVLRLLGVI